MITMVWPIMLTVLIRVVLMLHGVQCLEPEPGVPVQSGILDLPWQDEVCCDSPSTYTSDKGGSTSALETSSSELNLPHPPHCNFRSSETESPSQKPPGGACLDIMCRIDENWEKLTCDVKSHSEQSDKLDAGWMSVSLLQLRQRNDTDVNNSTSDVPVVCNAEDSLTCSLHLDSPRTFIVMATASISGVVSPPVLLKIPARPVKPSPPLNLSHIQTIEAELILSWDDPLDFGADLLRYEVWYSSSTNQSAWQVVPALKERRLSLDLKPIVNYIIQVRCSGPDEPPLWSEWSEPHHIFLDTVSYIPEKVVAQAGENVTVYCVFNDPSMNASDATWILNLTQPLHHSLYHPVNQRVSQITIRASETGIYDLLRCTREWSQPYSQIFVEGGFIDIQCVTNGDLDAMDCQWKNDEWTKLTFKYKWADLPCDVMEEKERAGENVGEMAHTCIQLRSKQKTCTIHPLRMNCYKLWLEVPSHQGPVRSQPVYLSPMDHIKPHKSSNVRAVVHSTGVLRVTWEPPFLPVEGLQCEYRYHSLSVIEKWEVQTPVHVSWAEVMVSDMCKVYVVQVRCLPINGTGYWSEWSDSVKSTTQNSRAPDRGPDFWRIREDDPHRNMSNITLLFKPVLGDSYCVEGFVVHHETWNGFVQKKQINVVSSYSFEWNQDIQTVTVEAYNSLGSSSNNINMTLEKQPKRRCLHSFHVSVINSTHVSLSWSLLDTSSVPIFMVVQWSPTRQQDSEVFNPDGQTWARLAYTEQSVYLQGIFFPSEEYGFYLYPVFSDGEGEPMFTLATKGDPAAYMMLMFISILCIIVFVTLVLSQNQVKRFVWKDVPDPNKCSWAKGVDFKTVDTFEVLFRPPEGLLALPLSSETISKVIVMDKAPTKALVQTPKFLTPDPVSASANSFLPLFDPKVNQSVESQTLHGVPSLTVTLDTLTTSNQSTDELQPAEPLVDQNLVNTNSSAQSSVTYSKVLLSDVKPDQQPVHLHYRDSSRSSSSDEGNFSANNSDISEPFTGGLWELESCPGADDPGRSCSYNSVEELSETSEHENEEDVVQEKHLNYLEIKHSMENDCEEEEEEMKTELLKNAALNKEDCLALLPLGSPEDMSESGRLLPASICGFSLYLPQYRTNSCTRQLPIQTQDSD